MREGGAASTTPVIFTGNRDCAVDAGISRCRVRRSMWLGRGLFAVEEQPQPFRQVFQGRFTLPYDKD